MFLGCPSCHLREPYGSKQRCRGRECQYGKRDPRKDLKRKSQSNFQETSFKAYLVEVIWTAHKFKESTVGNFAVLRSRPTQVSKNNMCPCRTTFRKEKCGCRGNKKEIIILYGPFDSFSTAKWRKDGCSKEDSRETPAKSKALA